VSVSDTLVVSAVLGLQYVLLHAALLSPLACWMIDGSSCRGSSRVVANQRLPASCMDLHQLQLMESVCTLLHTAAGVGMCLFYMQLGMPCCWSLFLLEKSGGPMAVCLKCSCSVRVYHRGCTCERDFAGFYFSFIK
jgi:hypothetical protein